MEQQLCTLQIHNGSALPKQPRPSFYSIRELQGKAMPSFFRHQLLACVENLYLFAFAKFGLYKELLLDAEKTNIR